MRFDLERIATVGNWKDRAYVASPIWLQQLGVKAFGWYWARRRLGPNFEAGWRAYVERETRPVERFREFIDQQLREQVQRAYREVPYYRRAFREHDVAEALLERFSVADLLQLPLLDKAKVHANPEMLLT